MKTTISRLHMEEETLIQLECNGGHDWHEAGDMRLLEAIKNHKLSLWSKFLIWIRGKA